MKNIFSLVLIVAGLAALGVIVGCRSSTPPVSEPVQDHRMHETASPATPPAPTEKSTAKTNSPAVTIGKDEAACPVLGTVMSKSMMIPVQHNGKTYYMCCRDCLAKFKADPEKYINHPATPTREMKHD